VRFGKQSSNNSSALFSSFRIHEHDRTAR
jgi:hypothetical protein